jgi:hypothetical protein
MGNTLTLHMCTFVCFDVQLSGGKNYWDSGGQLELYIIFFLIFLWHGNYCVRLCICVGGNINIPIRVEGKILESAWGPVHLDDISGVLGGEGGGEGSGLGMEFPNKSGAAGMREEAMEAGVSWKSWVDSRDGGKHQTLRRRGGGACYRPTLIFPDFSLFFLTF